MIHSSASGNANANAKVSRDVFLLFIIFQAIEGVRGLFFLRGTRIGKVHSRNIRRGMPTACIPFCIPKNGSPTTSTPASCHPHRFIHHHSPPPHPPRISLAKQPGGNETRLAAAAMAVLVAAVQLGVVVVVDYQTLVAT